MLLLSSNTEPSHLPPFSLTIKSIRGTVATGLSQSAKMAAFQFDTKRVIFKRFEICTESCALSFSRSLRFALEVTPLARNSTISCSLLLPLQSLTLTLPTSRVAAVLTSPWPWAPHGVDALHKLPVLSQDVPDFGCHTSHHSHAQKHVVGVRELDAYLAQW